MFVASGNGTKNIVYLSMLFFRIRVSLRLINKLSLETLYM